MQTKGKKLRTVDLVYMALFAALIAICSWISIPATVEFTMQTFAVFAALGLLGGYRALIAVCVYLLLGAVGLPVFAGPTEGTALGNLMVQFIFSGEYASLEEARAAIKKSFEIKEYLPR